MGLKSISCFCSFADRRLTQRLHRELVDSVENFILKAGLVLQQRCAAEIDLER